MKKFVVPCNFGGTVADFALHVGSPKDGVHPVQNQSDWLSKERGGSIPSEVMSSLEKLKQLADKNGVSFEELCVYALGAAQQADTKENQDGEAGTAEAASSTGEVAPDEDEESRKGS